MQTFLEMLRFFVTRHMMDGLDTLEQAVRMLANWGRWLLEEFVPSAAGRGNWTVARAREAGAAGLSAADRDVRDQVQEAMLGVIWQAGRGSVGFGQGTNPELTHLCLSTRAAASRIA